MKRGKKIWFLLVWSIVLLTPFMVANANTSPAPNFEKDFAKKLTGETPADIDGRKENVFNVSCVSKDNPLKENIKCLFFPGSTLGGKSWGALWDIVRYGGMILVFVYIVYAAINLIINSKKPENMKEAMNNLLYILIGSALFFGAMWLFGTVFTIGAINKTTGLKDNLTWSGGILFFVLSFLKGAAFFIAIIMIVITGFKMMNPKTGEAWEGKKLAKNLINIIFALVAMKVVDFIYYIASQADFAKHAGDFIIQIAKFLAYVSGSVMVVMIIYAGYLLIIDGGKGENFKKAKTMLINIVLAIASLFFFLFIIYQIFSEFN